MTAARTSLALRAGVCVCVSAILGGCTTHRARTAERGVAPLENFVEQVRQLSSVARPRRANEAETIERSDAELAEARLLLAAAPTAGNHRRVAQAYARVGVPDAAYDHFTAALRLEPRDATSLDGLARVWRDWGLPHLGLTHAYRAIYYAPGSPVARNTLGTLLLKMGRNADARAAFELALAMDPHAAYALNNLCFAALLQGDSLHAIEACRGAIREQPGLASARNNLALAYAASGDLAAAASEFSRASQPGAARYNMGVALWATRHFVDAAHAFDEASALRPSLTLARTRARQARSQAAEAASEGTSDSDTAR